MVIDAGTVGNGVPILILWRERRSQTFHSAAGTSRSRNRRSRQIQTVGRTYYTVSQKKDTDVIHTIDSTHINRFR